MAFTLDPARPLNDAVRHVSRKQWRRVTAGIAAGDSVHETRKALKRLRALGHLLAPALGRRHARRLDRDLRDLGRALAGRRDRDVLQTVWRGVGADLQLAPGVLAAGGAALSTWPGVPQATSRRSQRELIERIEARLERLPIARLGHDDLVRGAERTYRRARQGMAQAVDKNTSEAFHDWRKEVQRHWRHMTLLAALWPEAMAARSDLARGLSQSIGDEHDLSLLADWLGARELPTPVAAAAIRIQRHLDKRGALLRRRAVRDGRRLFAERPKAFARRLTIYAETMAPPAPGVPMLSPRGKTPTAQST